MLYIVQQRNKNRFPFFAASLALHATDLSNIERERLNQHTHNICRLDILHFSFAIIYDIYNLIFIFYKFYVKEYKIQTKINFHIVPTL